MHIRTPITVAVVAGPAPDHQHDVGYRRERTPDDRAERCDDWSAGL